MKYRDKNLGKSPFDPDYDDEYDMEKEIEAYEESCEARRKDK